ncbi:MAG: glutathione S-transferase [Myxococcaceae bacterium]|jgi:glutathione S-transferase|nr:glutathione S-transferase [Myxococcaceae bacterium]
MRLYFSPGACSLSPHIVMREAGIPVELELVSLNTHKTKSGHDFYGINPKGYVPVLELPDGSILTEGPVIAQYLADLKPESKLLPPAGTLERTRVQEWLNYVGTELHKGFGPLFSDAPDEYKTKVKQTLAKKFDFVSRSLEGKQYLTGDTFTVADAYLFTILRWSFPKKIDLPRLLAEYFTRVSDRPHVREALDAEKLAMPGHDAK